MTAYSAIVLAGGDGTRLPSTDRSKHVFEPYPGNLAVLPVSGLGWNDLGDPTRVLASQERAQAALASA